MKIVFLKDLETNETIAKDIYDEEGRLLIATGTKVSKGTISFLKKNNVFLVHVEDEKLSDIKVDRKMQKLKAKTLNKMPLIFNNILTGEYENTKEAMETVDELVDYVVEKGTINTNLYEVKLYDDYTYVHCLDTGIMAAFLGMSMGLTTAEVKELSISAMLHDIGKTKISNAIINKKSKLSDNEYEEMKKHPGFGRDILKNIGILSEKVVAGVYQHHERYDGNGYPEGIKGDEISLFGKLISICDVFTAVSANRSYRNRFKPNEAYELILASAGTMFDPKLVVDFKNTFFIYPLGSCVRLSNGIEGYVVKQNKGFPDRPIIRVIYGKTKEEEITPYEIDLLQHNDIIIDEVI
ncbi:HD-GYP domain-containing protein [Clostridium felsineum]|uniref:Uncharacterized protein n=1 Tax=Clostridium felsineum TaxID=36839 RepID=A0A1S8L8D9_9CLOT|nr:HD-GYP domain-containing protein [Clostridium felsineum]URZ02141.1 hypothetical protein CLAUR_021380 [Clostridium felsineum]URZ05089.1 hypothetical protein CLROS_004130 [Clostridium felsineum]URZ10130.1 hypothetical protein CROST_008380 [Clostridium felsineum]URZ17974.1 hypothetical protein CLFE_040290 [Clostridium felsineum DSM 794]